MSAQRRREYGEAERGMLLGVARRSIGRVVGHPSEEPVVELFPDPLREPRSSFVTLQRAHELRGCCGSLHADRPLVIDVWHSARAAAGADPRFAPLSAGELAGLSVEISVLSPLARIHAVSEAALLDALTPGEDGLYLRLGTSHATFLPKVWQSLPDPAAFLRALKHKAGWDEAFWSPQIECFRYGAESFDGPAMEGDECCR